MTTAAASGPGEAGRKVAIVTGASSGIGEATARLLARRGWHCVLVARREDRLHAIAAETGGEVELCDVGDREAVDAMAARVLERHPAINLLLNNAGMPARGTFLAVDPALVERVMGVNYLGGVWCTRAFLPGLRWAASGGGGAHVVNMVSVAGTVAFAPAGAYAASKHAQLAFSRSLASALRGTGIAVHAILPGFVETEGFPQKGVLRSRLLGRFVIQPPRVAEAVLTAVEKGRGEVTVPWFPYRAVSILQALAPGLIGRFAGMSDYRPGSV
jgi:short-subunit dehydrogenase